jgi:hypothetical protein
MTDTQLAASYRNLLIRLARDAEELKQEVETLRLAQPSQARSSKRNGMRTIINARNRQRARLLQILGRNSAASRQFFGTIVPEEIAKAEIVLQ